MNQIITLQSFWDIDDEITEKWGKKSYNFVSYCGLLPIKQGNRRDTPSTPKNSLSFACTGGDGVHFGLVDGKNEKGNYGPIVMTVPLATIDNVIIAEDLYEFFSLGYYAGWFGLEQLVYDLEDTITYYSAPDPEISKEEFVFLDIIRNKFSTYHIPLTTHRLAQLAKLYFHKLDIGDLEEWEAQQF